MKKDITSFFEVGHLLYQEKTPTVKFIFDNTLGNSAEKIEYTYNNQKTVLNTFGKFPYVYYVKYPNYRTFTLVHTFVGEFNENMERTMTPHEQFAIFQGQVLNRNPFVVENKKGDKFLASVDIKSISFPKQYDEEMAYIQAVLEFIEVGEV